MKRKMQYFGAVVLIACALGAQAKDEGQSETSKKAYNAVVYRSPSCGCCGKWISHLERNHFKVQDEITNDMNAVKRKFGVPTELSSCHTAIIDGYVVEGHVPAEDIRALILNKPPVTGVSAPGMPVGSPGMEMGGRKDAFDVVGFDQQGKVTVFRHHEE